VIPILDLQAQYRSIKPEIDAAIQRVVDSAHFALGPAVTDFEARFADYCGTREAIGVNSGTSALHLALLAAGVGPGDEVITTPFTFVATIAAVEYAGARPVFVDIDPSYYCLDPAELDETITPRTKAIVPVHLYGQPADMDPILAIARARNLVVIEDACQAHGAEYHGRRCGSIGAIGCFSFYPGKNLGAFGEGGAAVTSDPQLAATMRSLRAWGEETRYTHTRRGFNYRMDGIQGAVLGVKLRHLERWTEARRQRAEVHAKFLAGTSAAIPQVRPGSRHVFHQYAIRVPRRDALRQQLTEAGVQTGVHYPIPLHLQPAYRDLGYTEGDFPVAERVAREILSLPIFPELTDGQIEMIAGVIRAAAPAAASV
jgi:dTDP-4-amino-4,6-dideoxygalactose transaminase